MRPVNLLPPRYRPARASGERPGIGYAALGALAVVFLMVLLYVITQNGINDAKDKTTQANNEKAVADQKIGQLSSFGSFQQLKQQREAAVAGLAEVRFDYERLMRETALVLPKDVYLTSFSAAATPPSEDTATAAAGTATAAGPTITIAGCAPSHNAVAQTVVRLRKLHNATDVELQSSTKAAEAAAAGGAAGTAVCKDSFNATIAMKPETAPTAAASVPARLGGGQ